MTLYIAHNVALSTTTGIQAGRTIGATAQVTLQVQIPDDHCISIVEVGWSQDEPTPVATLLELATTDTGSTLDTAHSTTTVKPLNNSPPVSRMTMATTGTAYGEAAITSNTTLRTLHKLYVPQQYVYQWPLGTWPLVGNAAAESFLQLRVFPSASVDAIAWIIWNEE